MKPRALLLLLLLVVVGGPAPLAASGSKPVLVHYMPWFIAKPYSSSWGWHWTMNHFDPDTLTAAGKRDIASWYYPLIGPYDSADPAVLEYHVLLMKLSGIDGVIVDWYGMDNYADYAGIEQRTAALLYYTRKAGLAFSLCYEDQTVQHEIDGGFIKASDAVARARQTLLYAQAHYFTDPTYFRWSNQPVLFNFGPQFFKASADWQAIFSGLAANQQPAFFTEDNRLAAGVGAFNWPPMCLSQDNGGVLSTTQLESYLVGFEQKARQAPAWPAFVSSAFPRFHDIYATAGVSASLGYRDDNNGGTLRQTLSRAMTNASLCVQLVTWNDFGEGTVFEPTEEYGYRDLGTVQDFRRRYLAPDFPYHTNDLTLALRLFNLRRAYATNTLITAELDRVFMNIVSGKLVAADLQLAGVESKLPVIYDLSCAAGQLSFLIGGYLSSSGVQVQSATNLETTAWKTIETYPPTTDPMAFTNRVLPQAGPVFFKARAPGGP